MSREDLERHQLSAFSELWKYVREHSAFYHRRYPGAVTLEEILPCSREEYSENFNDINTAGLDRDELVRFRIAEEIGRASCRERV